MKAIWAFEPFHQDSTRTKDMHSLLSQIAGSPSNIEVAFVATRTESSLNLAFDIPEKDRFNLYPRKLIKQELKAAKVKMDDKNIHVIDYETLSNSKAADRLLNFAQDREAEVLGIFTHAKKGYSRFTLGSFAETAIHRSPLSLLILTPATSSPKKIQNVLYASDFSSLSKKHLQKVILLCSQLKSSLTVFHHAEIRYKWSVDEKNPDIKSYRKKVDQMKRWIELQCAVAKVKVVISIATEFDATSNLVLTCAKKKKADLVVVSAKVGPALALIGGSITRQIVRRSPVPILVLK